MPKSSLAQAALRILSESANADLQANAVKGQDAPQLSNDAEDVGGPTVTSEPHSDDFAIGKKESAQAKQAEHPAPNVAPAQEKQTVKEDANDDDKDDSDDEETIKEQKNTQIRDYLKTISVEEDINAMFSGSDISEETKEKIKTIFEAAVISRSLDVIQALEEEILEAAELAVEEIKEEQDKKIDSYLDYMVSEWVKNNEVAVETGLRYEIYENFMSGLRQLFLDHDLNIPEESVNVVEELSEKVATLEAQINEELNKNAELNKAVNEAKRKELLAAVCEGLTITQAEKLKTLAEGVEFTTDSEYKGKIVIIKEQYFSGKVNEKTIVNDPVVIGESVDAPVVTEPKKIDPFMQSVQNILKNPKY